METKRLPAEKAVSYLNDGMTVGLGTGSTTFWAIQKIGERVKQGLKIKAVSSSDRSETLARELGIPLISFDDVRQIDITIDGADEVDEKLNLIKGGGGALLREKILVYNSKKFLVIVDESKLVKQLGKFPLPVEIIPFATNLTLEHLKKLGCEPSIRTDKDHTYKTDNGNLIADCQFNHIPDPLAMELKIKSIPGVVDTGLFMNELVSSVFVGCKDGTVKIIDNSL